MAELDEITLVAGVPQESGEVPSLAVIRDALAVLLAAVEGTVGHGADDTTSVGSKIAARTTASVSGETLLAAAKRTNLYAGLDGVLIHRPHCNLEDIVTRVSTSITDGSSTSVVEALGSGIKFYCTDIIISNDSDIDVLVNLRDGAAGTVKATCPVPAKVDGVDGFAKSFEVPIPFSANTAVCADPSAVTTGGGIVVTLIGFKSKV